MAIVFRCARCEQRYRVPDERAGSRGKCKQCGAPLLVPSGPEVEQTPGGSTVYRHQPRQHDFEPAVGDEETIEAISDHIQEHVGEIDGVYHEIVSDLVHIDVHIVRPTRERPFQTLITSGMSDRPMSPPEEAAEQAHAELMIYLPPDWPLDEESLEDENNYWPIRLLKMLARLPHEYDTWLFLDHTVPNGDPAEPYADDTEFVCALLAVPILEDEEFWALELEDGRTIYFLTILPLYLEEMNFKLQRGSDKLLERFDRYDVSPVIDVNRRNVCRKKFGIF